MAAFRGGTGKVGGTRKPYKAPAKPSHTGFSTHKVTEPITRTPTPTRVSTPAKPTAPMRAPSKAAYTSGAATRNTPATPAEVTPPTKRRKGSPASQLLDRVLTKAGARSGVGRLAKTR